LFIEDNFDSDSLTKKLEIVAQSELFCTEFCPPLFVVSPFWWTLYCMSCPLSIIKIVFNKQSILKTRITGNCIWFCNISILCLFDEDYSIKASYELIYISVRYLHVAQSELFCTEFCPPLFVVSPFWWTLYCMSCPLSIDGLWFPRKSLRNYVFPCSLSFYLNNWKIVNNVSCIYIK
jgi:hypothetical protein